MVLPEQCPYMYPSFDFMAEYAILDRCCLFPESHGTDDHLVCMFNPILAPEFVLWTPDRENDDGSEDYQDFVCGEISQEEAYNLIRQHWGDKADVVIAAIERATR
jgi:hypothetical protein